MGWPTSPKDPVVFSSPVLKLTLVSLCLCILEKLSPGPSGWSSVLMLVWQATDQLLYLLNESINLMYFAMNYFPFWASMHITSHHTVQQGEGLGVLVSGFKLIAVAFGTILHRIYPAPSLHSWHTWLPLPPAGEVTARKMSGHGHLLGSVFARLQCQYFIGQTLSGGFVWVCSPSWIGCQAPTFAASASGAPLSIFRAQKTSLGMQSVSFWRSASNLLSSAPDTAAASRYLQEDSQDFCFLLFFCVFLLSLFQREQYFAIATAS